MNSIHNNGKDGKSLDQDLEELDLRYQSVASEEPPELLDQAILNQAHRAVESKNSWLDFGWIHGLTTVALVVLSFSVIVSMRETGEFDPTTAPLSDAPEAPLNRRANNQTVGELKAKDDSESDNQLNEEAAAPKRQVKAQESLESSETRFRQERQIPAEREAGDAAPSDVVSSDLAPASLATAPKAPPAPVAKAAVDASDNREIKVTGEAAEAAEAIILAEPETSNRAAYDDLTVNAKKESEKQDNKNISEKIVDSNSGLDKTTASDQLSPSLALEEVIILNDNDSSGRLDLAQQTELLDIILQQKLAGDENWKAELEAFVKSYPDYPLPEELQP